MIALPMAKLVSTVGLPFMSAAVILSSLLQLLFGVLRLSSVLNVVTEPVICGFLNALGIFLVQTQLKIFKTPGGGAWLNPTALVPSLLTAALCACIIKLLPRVKKDSPVPPSLVGLLVASVAAHALQWTKHIKTLSGMVGSGAQFAGGMAALPAFIGLPNVPISQATLAIIGSTAVSAVNYY